MSLSTITLQNFRSYTKKTFLFSDNTTIIVGANAAGKTNILEAIMMLAVGKSFRAGADREVIRWNTDISRIGSLVGDTKLEVMLTNGIVGGAHAPLKKYLVNGIPRRMIDFLGNVRAVLFWPEDLEIITDSPSIRRKYLDTVLIQVDREYRRNLLSYERGIRQRNKLLDQISDGTATRAQLLFWNQLLIRAGSYITEKRATFIDFINMTKLVDHQFVIHYDHSVISEARLDQYKYEEVAAKSTLVGPHRDDFHIQSHEYTDKKDTVGSDRDMNKYGSRGEQRLAVLWLKLAEVSYVEKETGSRPILLLDDIFSELDHAHRALVAELTDKQQTIMTSADFESVPSDIRKHAAIITV